MLKDSPSGYGLLSILLHWVCALLILFLFGLGVYMTGLGYYDEWYHKGPALHVSLGLIVFALMALRILWRWINPTPSPLGHQAVQLVAAQGVKWLLYLAIFCVLISGYLITTAEGKPASLFDWLHIPALTRLTASQVDLAGKIHEYCAWGIIALVVLHVLGALYHQFVVRDRTLVRIFKPVKK